MARTASDISFIQSEMNIISNGVNLDEMTCLMELLHTRQAAAKCYIKRPNEANLWLSQIEGLNRRIAQLLHLNLK